ncbi:MAG: hypothetical protein WC755_01655 [Candidatus Woesearchaeota archaeon]|jgi:transcriptional regulator with XRE-family HTH domain
MRYQKHTKNKLMESFGKIVAGIRGNMVLNSAEFAKKIHMGSSYYRLIEAGAVPFPSHHLIDICNTLEGKIEYVPAAIINSIISKIEKINGSDLNDTEKYEEIKKHFQLVGEYDKKFKELAKHYEKNDFQVYLKQYLTNYEKFEESPKEEEIKTIKQLLDMPSLYFEEIRKSTSKYPETYTLDSLLKLIPTKKINNTHIFYKDSKIVENISRFNFKNPQLKQIDETTFLKYEKNNSYHDIIFYFKTPEGNHGFLGYMKEDILLCSNLSYKQTLELLASEVIDETKN